MKITICGSTAFILEMEKLAEELEQLGHEVQFPPVEFIDGDGKKWHTLDYYQFKKQDESLAHPSFLNNHTQRIRDHFDCVKWADAILVMNHDKNNIAGYIGPNTLMEMGLAFYLNKPIYLLNAVPEVAWKEEILGLRPVTINNNLKQIV